MLVLTVMPPPGVLLRPEVDPIPVVFAAYDLDARQFSELRATLRELTESVTDQGDSAAPDRVSPGGMGRRSAH